MLIVKNPWYQPPVVTIMAAAANVSERLGITLRITDTIGNGVHGKWSLHYRFGALDLGSKEHKEKQRIVDELRKELGATFDVILEGLGTDNEHIHAEHDPK
jgi:hypothetical protein